MVVGGGGSGGSLRRVDRRLSERREGEMDGAKRSGGGRSRGAAAGELLALSTSYSSLFCLSFSLPLLCRRRRGGRPLQRHRHDGHGLPVSLRLLPTADLARLLCHSPRRLAARPSPALPVRANPGWRPLRCRPSSRCSPPAPPTSATHLAKLKEDHAHTSSSIPGMHLRPRRRRRFSVLLSEDEEEEREEREGIKVFISYVQLIYVSHCFF